MQKGSANNIKLSERKEEEAYRYYLKKHVKDLGKPDFWIQAWVEARQNLNTEKRKIRDKEEAIEFWNKFAPKYDKKHTQGKKDERLTRVINILKEKQFIDQDTQVLDVGCGTGNYALPLSQICKSVTALDGAAEMCRQLEKKIKAEKVSNIRVIHHLWEDIDIKAESLYKSFDLVFASMNPGICDYDTLNRMNLTSKKNCCLIFWAEGSSSLARQDLWQILFNEEDSGYGGAGIIYPFNLLFSLGYFPEIQYIDSEWGHEETIEEAIESLCRSFWLFTEITPEVKKTISNYVKEKAVGNTFMQKTKARLGVVTWSVEG